MNHFFLLRQKFALCSKSIIREKATLLYALLLIVFIFGNGELAEAQPNCANSPVTMITNFADWQWEIPSSDANYCATWTVQTGNQNTRFLAGAPWISPTGNGPLNQINLSKDYTKANGWELLRMNMGGRGGIAIPYFFLYNKYRSIIRTYFYINNLSAFPSGINITMSHASSNGSYSSGILAPSQPLTQSQEYYFQNRSANREIISYTPVFTSQRGWVFADFLVGFDQTVGSALYTSSSLEFDVLAVTNSTIRLDGKLNFRTGPELQAGGYGIGGTATGVGTSGLNNFLANGQKILTAFSSDDLLKFKDNFTVKADKTAATVSLPVVQTQQTVLKSAVASGTNAIGIFKKLMNAAGSLGAAFGIASTLIGILWPDDPAASPASIPTVSSGTLSLKGTISTTSPLTSLIMDVPGGQHFYPNSTNPTEGITHPYYDCPLGLFNIKNTPQLAKYAFSIYDGRNCEYDDLRRQWICEDGISQFDCYQVTNDLTAVYNAAAGLNLQSVQAALVAETPPAVFNKVPGPFSENPRTTPLPGFLLQRVYSGEVEVITANDSLVTYATPFIDLGSFKNAAITVGRGSKVYVRIKAVLQRKDKPVDAPPIFFVQDYAVQVSPTTTETNPRFALSVRSLDPLNPNFYANGEAPFTNLASALLVPTINPGPPYSARQPEFTSTAPYLVPARSYWSSDLQVSSLTMVSAGATPLNPTGGAVAVRGVPGLDRALLLSNVGIALGAGFSVQPGAELVAATPLQAWRQGGPALIEPFVGRCSYNSNTSYNPVAYRLGSAANTPGTGSPAVLTDELTASPNPTDGLITVATAVADETGAVLVVSDYMGKEVQRLESIPAGLSNQQLNLTGKASGLYLIRLITSGKTVTQRVVLQ